MESLTVSEYAKLAGKTSRYIRQQISEGKIKAFGSVEKGRGGSSGFSYKIPAGTLDPKLYIKYKREQERKKGVKKMKSEKPQQPVTIEEMSECERREVAFWKKTIVEWRAFRSQEGKKEELDQIFLEELQAQYPEMQLSVRMIKRKDKVLREQGEAALIDGRGKHGNHKKAVPDEVFAIFTSYYLDESRKSVRKCMELTEIYLKREHKEDLLPLASSQSFTREILRSIPPAAVVFCREGLKACTDKMLPFIHRTYEDLQSNDIWVCDNHTFDVFINDGEHAKPVRVYLTAFQDVRSRKFVGWYVTLSPNSMATLIALRRGIEKYGIPKRILSDNGREFLTFDIGGRGFRKSRKLAKDEHEIPTILQNLGIEFTTAMVRNARAKIIERAFLDVKNGFSKMFEGYTGGTIAERPERLKKTGKDADNFILLPDFIEYVDLYIEGMFNKHKHYGIGMNGRTPDQVYAACLTEQRIATTEQLNLMMLRNTRMQKVTRDGVYVTLYGEKVPFNSPELNFYHINRKVYVRYNPDDLREARVYDDQDRFLCVAQQTDSISYFADKDKVKEHIRKNRKYARAVQDWVDVNVNKSLDELDLIMWQAEQNIKEDGCRPDPNIVEIHALDKKAVEQLPKAVGYGDDEPVDYTLAVERLRDAQEG
ncbi:MAG: DDE-type integrase/transposase/recombinase [Lachnospiraceae bacterium]|jgi:putative transposase|nr:DDE-type integrase/transposase/recombinase [Lachnospiraceae bacterium]